MLSEAQTAALVRRPRVLANVLHHLADLDEQAAPDQYRRLTRLATHTLPAIAYEVATTIGPDEFTDACTNCTPDDIDAALEEHTEIYGKVLPWDGSIIKLILANLPAIIDALKILIGLLAKTP